MAETDWLIALTVPPALEEAVVDWLLSLETGSGFTSYPVSGHSGHTEAMSLAEQVSGRKLHVRFELHVEASAAGPILERFRRDFRGTRIHYWSVPVGSHGTI